MRLTLKLKVSCGRDKNISTKKIKIFKRLAHFFGLAFCNFKPKQSLGNGKTCGRHCFCQKGLD